MKPRLYDNAKVSVTVSSTKNRIKPIRVSRWITMVTLPQPSIVNIVVVPFFVWDAAIIAETQRLSIHFFFKSSSVPSFSIRIIIPTCSKVGIVTIDSRKSQLSEHGLSSSPWTAESNKKPPLMWRRKLNTNAKICIRFKQSANRPPTSRFDWQPKPLHRWRSCIGTRHRVQAR